MPSLRRLRREVRLGPARSWYAEVAIGAVAAAVAIVVRLLIPLGPQQIPTLTVVVMLAIVTTFVGIRAGVTTAVVGGLAAWYLFFNPQSFSLGNGAWVPLMGFVVIAMVIVSTSYLYRRSERLLHAEELAKLEDQAANAELFAREMAHRQKNALDIVQAIAFQTIGSDVPEAAKFAGRLKALADANELLNEHVRQPTANVRQVVEAALRPFSHGRIHVESVDAAIPSQQVVSLALGLHELATNAVKYGALSKPDGSATLKVEDAGDRLQLDWKERDGPAVKAPETNGFGTRLLQRAGLNTRFEFEPDGLRCSFGIRKA